MFIWEYSLVNEWTTKMCYMCTVEYYSTVSMKLANKWLELETIILTEAA